MNEYLVEWVEFNKETTKFKEGTFQETVEAENDLEAIELVKQYIFDNSEDRNIELTENGIEFETFEYCNFVAVQK